MKSFCTGFFLLASLACLQAQITVTNATFPAVGDSLKTATDLAPVNITISGQGGPYTWDFSNLIASTRQATFFQQASAGTAFANFPNAELVTIGEGGFETYYNVSATTFDNLGFYGNDPTGTLPIAALLKYVPSLPERYAPLMLFSFFQTTSEAQIPIATADIPAAILDSLGIPAGLVDSVRVRFSINRVDLVDAFGSITIPGGTYDVLREKRTDFTTITIDAHISFLGWVPISNLIPGFSIPPDTTTTYRFMSNAAKEPIAIVTTDSAGAAQQVEYKDLGIVNAVVNVSSQPLVLISPNPVSDEAVIDLRNLPAGNYTAHLFDVNGHLVFEKKLSADRETIQLNSFANGTYFFRIKNEKNQVMTSVKLLKM